MKNNIYIYPPLIDIGDEIMSFDLRISLLKDKYKKNESEKMQFIAIAAEILNQSIDILDFVYFLVTRNNLENEDIYSYFEKILEWFSDDIEKKSELNKAGERIKTYCIYNTGFMGIISNNFAKGILEEYKGRKNNYFVIGCDIDNKQEFTLFTTKGNRIIKGSELDSYYNQKSIFKPVNESMFKFYSLYNIYSHATSEALDLMMD